MSLLMLKTKNLSWQDHTLNIEVMLAPLRSTLLLNKHKTLDTKSEKEKALYERQKDACVKDFVVEKRLIERRRQKLMKRKKDILNENRAKSALEKEEEEEKAAANQERSSSAPGRDRTRHEAETTTPYHSGLPKLTLKHTPLFGGTLLRPRLFLETGNVQTTEGKHGKSRGSVTSTGSGLPTQDGSRKSTARTDRKPPVPPSKESDNPRGLPRRIPGVTFLDFLEQEDSEDETNIMVEVKPKTVEEKVRDFLRDMDKFNSRPPTACSSVEGRTDDSLVSSRYTRGFSDRSGGPQAANRYTSFTLDKKSLEKSFDRYCEKKSHEDLLKAMKLAAKMKAHIRQARNASIMPTMASFKSSRSFMRLLKRQQRRDKQITQDA